MKYDIVNELDKNSINVINLVYLKIFNSVVSIYFHKFEKSLSVRPEQVATGVLIKTEDNFYLVTASHTFNDYEKEDICLINSIKKIPLVGRLYKYDTNESYENDLIDIAVIRLKKFVVEEINKIKEFSFLDSKLILENHNLVQSKSYFTIGYPYKKEKINVKLKKYGAAPYLLYIHPSNLKKYDQPFVDKGINYLMSYNRRKQISLDSGNRVMAPYLKGMSGSGLWFGLNLILK